MTFFMVNFDFYFYPMENILLSSAYLAPIQYYNEIANAENILIEQYDSYHKQTYRNRCRVLAGNGPIDLIIPIVKNSGVKTLMKDVQIEYLMPWQDKHWRTIISAYNSSPFFEYYRDDLQPFFEKRWKYLIDLNTSLHELILELLELPINVKKTTDFIKDFEGTDLRNAISPKKNKKSRITDLKEYTQTFNERFGFVPNLSIIDLLFNVGPEAGDFLCS